MLYKEIQVKNFYKIKKRESVSLHSLLFCEKKILLLFLLCTKQTDFCRVSARLLFLIVE